VVQSHKHEALSSQTEKAYNEVERAFGTRSGTGSENRESLGMNGSLSNLTLMGLL
jgi:hypothetical protein